VTWMTLEKLHAQQRKKVHDFYDALALRLLEERRQTLERLECAIAAMESDLRAQENDED
jgi:hypothetical protein